MPWIAQTKKNGAKRRSSKARIFWCVFMMDNLQWLYSDFNNRGRIDYMGLRITTTEQRMNPTQIYE